MPTRNHNENEPNNQTLKIRVIREIRAKHTSNIHETYYSHPSNPYHSPQSISYNRFKSPLDKGDLGG